MTWWKICIKNGVNTKVRRTRNIIWWKRVQRCLSKKTVKMSRLYLLRSWNQYYVRLIVTKQHRNKVQKLSRRFLLTRQTTLVRGALTGYRKYPSMKVEKYSRLGHLLVPLSLLFQRK